MQFYEAKSVRTTNKSIMTIIYANIVTKHFLILHDFVFSFTTSDSCYVDVNRLMWVQGPGTWMDRGLHVLYLPHITLPVVSNRCVFLAAACVRVCVCVCRQWASRRPPVCICLTAAREPGPSSALSIRELSLAGSPHRCCAYRQKDIRLHCVV